MASAEFSDGDASFEVDQILNQRKRKGILEYMVRWKGFGKNEDSWEPAKNLKNCANALTEYMKAIAAAKTPKKSTKSRSKSRSRSRSKSRTTKSKSSPARTPRGRSRTPRARSRTPKAQAKTPTSRTPRSRSRSSSRGRTTKVKESPSRQSRRTEVITKSSTNKEPGRVEKKTEVFKQTTEDSKPTEVTTTRVVRSRVEVKTVEDKVDGKLVARESTFSDKLQTIWQSADMAALILFICVSVIVLSYIVENKYSVSDMWKAVVGVFSCIFGSIKGFFQLLESGLGRIMETTANFTRQSWKKITN